MASEDDNKDNLAEVNNQNDNNTETTDPAASSDAKGESSEDKSTTVDKDEGEKEVKLYVGNLPDQCRRAALQELFEKFGKVSQCDIVKNFAFVVSVIRKEQLRSRTCHTPNYTRYEHATNAMFRRFTHTL